MRTRRPVGGTTLAVSAGLIFAVNNVITKLAYQTELNVLSFLVVRTGIAAIIICAITMINDRFSQIGRRTFVVLILIGALAYAGQSVLFNVALTRMPAATAVMGLYTYPIVVAVISACLGRERLRPLSSIALVLGVSGVFLSLGISGQGVTLPEALLAVSSGLTWGVTIVIIQRTTTLVSPMVYSAVVLAGMTASLATVGLLTGSVTVPESASAWKWIGLSAVAMVVGVAAFAGALARLGSTRASVGNTVEPPATGVIAGVVLGEQVTVPLVVGTALVTCALALLYKDGNILPKVE